MREGPQTPRRYLEGGVARGNPPSPNTEKWPQGCLTISSVEIRADVLVSKGQCRSVSVQACGCSFGGRGLCGLSPELWAGVLRPNPALRLLLQLGPGARPLLTFRQPTCGVRGCRTSESTQGPPVTLAGASRSEPSRPGPHTGTAQCPLVNGVECPPWAQP